MAASRPISSGEVLRPRALDLPRLLRTRSNAWLVAGGVVLLAGTTALAVPAYNTMRPGYAYLFGEGAAPVYAFLGAAPAVVLVAAGLLARWSHPASRIGLLLIVEGLAWNLNPIILSATDLPAGVELAAITTFISYAVGAHVLLRIPADAFVTHATAGSSSCSTSPSARRSSCAPFSTATSVPVAR